jgi:RND family efflux transporter MFP subunit
VKRAAIAVVAIFLLLVAAGVLPRLERREARARARAEATGPKHVSVAEVVPGPKTIELTLPGTLAPVQSTIVYARTTGFVRKLHTDIGDKVAAGALLAELSAPETNDELDVVRARVQEGERNAELARQNADRQNKLAEEGVTSRERADDARARANTVEAALGSSRAELQRLSQLYGNQRIVAPFAGVVTKRFVDVGALITPGSGIAGTALFELSDTKALRVFVDVPQHLAGNVAQGMKTQVYSPRDPSHVAPGVVVRTAGALDATTRTLRTEVSVPPGVLLPGSFVSVKLALERATPPLVAPASALSVQKEGTQLVRLLDDGTVDRKTVVLGRDLGKIVEVLSGIEAGQKVVISPQDSLQTGDKVIAAGK